MQNLHPFFTIDLMQPLDDKLIELLKSLSGEDWERPTYAGQWKVKDIAAHLLDGNLRSLSMLRDGYFGENPGQIETYQDLVAFLNHLNADWVKAMHRMSPKLLIELLEITGRSYCAYLASLDPMDTALFAVAWAGEESSLNWFHIAREYTEKWHHQQQIRAAVGKEEDLYESKWYGPYLDCALRALPYHYRQVKPERNTLLCIQILDRAYFLSYEDPSWHLQDSANKVPDCILNIPYEIAWRIFTKGISEAEAEFLSEIKGHYDIAKPFFSMRAVMI